MSSSAFFIEAAANTVRLLSCASAGDEAAAHRMAKLKKSPARRCIVALHACLRAAVRARKSGFGRGAMRQAEAPFRQSGGFAIRPDIAISSLQHRQRQEKALRRPSGVANPAHSEAGTIARLMESASTPEIWMVKGFGGISNFTLFRIPSHPLPPLDVP